MFQRNGLADIVGPERFFEDETVLQDYSRDFSASPPMSPGCVVKADSAEEVRQIVHWASETGTPLVPVSSGPPHFFGDTIPGVGGACVVDLSGMKRIIRIDRRNRSVMIEPGVTFGQLIPALEKEGLSPLIPLLPKASKSVAAAFLERTPIILPRHHWEAQDPLQCVEVIYGNGELMRTGSAAGPGTLEEQWKVGRAQVRGMGPSQVDFTRLLQGAQGTLGIVTWATIRCRPLPKVKHAWLVASEDIRPLIELVYRLTYKKLGEELFILNRTQAGRVAGKKTPEIENLPQWILYCTFDGDGFFPEDRVAYQENEFRKLGWELDLAVETERSGLAADDLAGLFSKPSREPFWKLEPKGGNEDIFFITTLDRSPGFIARMFEMVADSGFESANMGVYIQPTIQGCNCHLEFSLAYDLENEPETRALARLSEEGGAAMAQMGGFFSRPYGNWSRFAYDSQGAHARGMKTLKEIFDPKNILNPGRLGFQE